MRIAVDIDGTITRWPNQCRVILDTFPDAMILTGNITNGMTQEQLVEGRRAQLLPFIGEKTRTIVVCTGTTVAGVAHAKGEYCRDNQIDLLIDDSDIYLDAVARLSPKTARWKSMQ